MSARGKKKRAPEGVRREWWEQPTFATYGLSSQHNGPSVVRIELILPDGERVDLGRFIDTGSTDDIRPAIAEHFKKIWDPEKRRRRTPTT